MSHNKKTSVLTNLMRNSPQLFAYTIYGYRMPTLLMPAISFNGQYRDPLTGNYHLGSGYRIYNTAIMRFHSPDSASPFGRGGLNTYAYCTGDPVNYQDPSGHGPLDFLNLFSKKKTLMQRRQKAESAMKENPALKRYKSIVDDSLKMEELKTISDTGKALDDFEKLLGKGYIYEDRTGKFMYDRIMDHYDRGNIKELEQIVILNEKILDNTLPSYPTTQSPKPNSSSTSHNLSLEEANKITRAR